MTSEANRKTILIVDDTPENLTVMVGVLKDCYRTRVATNGAKALAPAGGDEPPDLILLGVINEILDFSKIDAGRMSVEHIPVRLGSMVEGVAATLRNVAEAKDVALIHGVDPALLEWIMGDPVRLRQILFNLIGNGIMFTPAGGAGPLAARLDCRRAAAAARGLPAARGKASGIDDDGSRLSLMNPTVKRPRLTAGQPALAGIAMLEHRAPENEDIDPRIMAAGGGILRHTWPRPDAPTAGPRAILQLPAGL